MRPSRSARSHACARRSSFVRPNFTTSAPQSRTAATFTPAASTGITITARTPSSEAASATAPPWLPLLPVTTPALRQSARFFEIAL